MEFEISIIIAISAGLTIARIAFIFLIIVDALSLVRFTNATENMKNNEKKVLSGINGFFKNIFIIMLVFGIGATVSFGIDLVCSKFTKSVYYELLNIINLALIAASSIVSLVYIILSFALSKKDDIKSKIIIVTCAIIAFLIIYFSKSIIDNTYSDSDYEKYYEYKNGDHAYIESIIEREEHA